MRILTTSLCFVALSTGAFAQQRPAYLIAKYGVIDAASMKKFGEAIEPDRESAWWAIRGTSDHRYTSDR
jgi:hypothetical protein